MSKVMVMIIACIAALVGLIVYSESKCSGCRDDSSYATGLATGIAMK